MNKDYSYLEYLKTAVITMIFLIVIAVGLLFAARIQAGNHITDDEKAIQEDMIGYLISKYKYSESESPKNASINLKLGQLYEMLGSYQQAEEQYNIAIEKRGGVYEAASFALAGVYLLKKDYEAAQAVMDGMQDASKYSVILEKGKFYKGYGNSLFNDGDFNGAIEKYDKALFYLTKINNSLVKDVTTSKCEACVAMADELVSKNKTVEAIEELENARSNCKNPLVLYKLGLLYFDKEPEKSVELFEKVLKADPSIINFGIYKRLLFALKMQYEYAGDALKSKLYDSKLVRLRSYVQRNVLSSDEILLTDYDFKIKRFPIRNEYDVIYTFNVENITNQDISKLFVIIELYDKNGNKIYEYEHNISPSAGGFKAAGGAVPVKVLLRMKKNIIQQFDKIDLKMYLAKNPKVTKLLYSGNSMDVTKGKKSK